MRERLVRVAKRLRALLCRGRRYYCPLCDRGYRRFLSAGLPRRPNVRCPGCDSFERHRLLWLALLRLWDEGVLRSEGRLLHVAPENCLGQALASRFDCLLVDLAPRPGVEAMDVRRIPEPADSFDAIICNHVLEHVEEDGRALSELFRVLKPGGWASIQVPMEGSATFEDPSIRDAEGRTRFFGQPDHVRKYGRDFRQRLEKAGFTVCIRPKESLGTPDQLRRLSLDVESEVWLSQKPEPR